MKVMTSSGSICKSHAFYGSERTDSSEQLVSHHREDGCDKNYEFVMVISLLSRKLVCVVRTTSILIFPSDQQLGFRGNDISFTNDIATVSRELPRALKDCRGSIPTIACKQNQRGGAMHLLVR